ncbi:MAG: hypothetical protein ACJAQW_000515 [Paracoccaceae bacterium]|jgi:hypothetical protein
MPEPLLGQTLEAFQTPLSRLCRSDNQKETRQSRRMTALDQYTRLECPGIWRAAPDAQRINVVAAFGVSSLVITDNNGRAMSHWSLAAVVRINPGIRPALFCPSPEAGEELELADDTMIDAIEKVRRAVVRSRPQGGRLRRLLSAGAAAAIIAALVVWLPNAITRHTLRVVPASTHTTIGTALFQAIGRVSGAPCRSARGDIALARLYTRLLAPTDGGLLIMPAGIDGAVALPGGLILLSRTLVEDHDTADVVAGFILTEHIRRTRTDPLKKFLNAAGLRTTLHLLTTGEVSPVALNTYAEALVVEQPAPVPVENALSSFRDAEISSTPYAYALDITGETTLELIEADPMRAGRTTSILPDSDWVALQQICEG